MLGRRGSEPFLATVEREFIDTRARPTGSELHPPSSGTSRVGSSMRVIHQLHSSLGCLSPVQYERLHHTADRQAAESTAATSPSNRIEPDANAGMVQTFPPELTGLQRFVLDLLDVPEDRYR